jgi:hypothetical protein
MRRQLVGFHPFAGDAFRDIRRGQNKVVRRVVGIKVNKIFQHGQRLVFRGISQARSQA